MASIEDVGEHAQLVHVPQLGFEFESALAAERLERARKGGTQRSGTSKPRISQLALPLDHQPGTKNELTIRGQVRIEQTLRNCLGPRVIVSLTSNRSTMISYNRRRGVLYVRVHAIFADAPSDVIEAMAVFVSDGRATTRQARLIDDWIELNRHQIRKPDRRSMIVQPQGEVHDLRTSMDRLNALHFDNGIKAAITWSKSARNQKRTSIRMGSYCDEQHLIRIHPALDQTFVPRYFVESVIFHEMLHQSHGVEEKKDGRRCIHSPEFMADERLFPEYDDARRWERKNLTKLLRY